MRLFSCVVLAALVMGLVGRPALATDVDAAKLGQKIGDVTLVDQAAKKVSLHDLAGTKATVVVFFSFECPISTSVFPRAGRNGQALRRQGRRLCGRLRERSRNARHRRQAGGRL